MSVVLADGSGCARRRANSGNRHLPVLRIRPGCRWKPRSFWTVTDDRTDVVQVEVAMLQIVRKSRGLSLSYKAPEGWQSPRRCALLLRPHRAPASWTAAAFRRFSRQGIKPLLLVTATGHDQTKIILDSLGRPK